MTYNLKLDEREFNILLSLITNNEFSSYDIVKPSENSRYDDENKEICFNELLEYGNAFLVKVIGVDEDSGSLNCETHIKQCEDKSDWFDDYEIVNGVNIRKKNMQ